MVTQTGVEPFPYACQALWRARAMPRRHRRHQLGTAPWNRVLSTHGGELRREHYDERLTDRPIDSRSGASSGAQKTRQLLHNLLHDSGHGRPARGIISNLFDLT